MIEISEKKKKNKPFSSVSESPDINSENATTETLRQD